MKAVFTLLNSTIPQEKIKNLMGINLIDKPAGKNILILAPHRDDEIIGCGGAMIKHQIAGDHITVVYLTGSSNQRDKRTSETLRALSVLDIKDYYFLGFKDNNLHCNEESVNKMKDILLIKKPDLVYVPNIFEEHNDHKNTLNIFIQAAGFLSSDLSIISYEVWNPLIPNCLIDISEVFEKKLTALRAYQSQLILYNLENLTISLSRYRATLLRFKKYKYAEAFFLADLNQYQKMMADYDFFYQRIVSG